MEKDILIQNLRTKVGEDNCRTISDKTFEGIANVYHPLFEDDSKITEDLWKFPIAALNEFAGQKRHDEKEFAERFKSEYAAQHEKDVATRISTEVAKALEEYKKAHPENKPSEKQTPPSNEDVQEQVSKAVAEAMGGLTGSEGAIGKALSQITEFIKTQSEREKNAARASVKAKLKDHLIALKANNIACVDDALEDIDYGENPTFESLKQSAISAYEKRYKRYYSDGGKPFGGTSTGGAGGENSYVKNKIAALKQEAEDNANYAKEQEKTFV